VLGALTSRLISPRDVQGVARLFEKMDAPFFGQRRDMLFAAKDGVKVRASDIFGGGAEGFPLQV
jgi:hypothetical protein